MGAHPVFFPCWVRNTDLMVLLRASLDAAAKRVLDAKGVLPPEDEPVARLDAFRALSARYAST